MPPCRDGVRFTRFDFQKNERTTRRFTRPNVAVTCYPFLFTAHSGMRRVTGGGGGSCYHKRRSTQAQIWQQLHQSISSELRPLWAVRTIFISRKMAKEKHERNTVTNLSEIALRILYYISHAVSFRVNLNFFRISFVSPCRHSLQ